MAYDVKVKIDLTKPTGTIGFGMPLILLENAESEIEYTEVSDMAGVAEAGFEADSDAYKAAQLIFAQRSAPRQIAVCAVTGSATEALTDAALTGKAWRQLIVVNGGETASAVTAISAAVDAVVNPLFLVDKVLNIFDSLGADRKEKCRLVNNGIYRENIPGPGGWSYDPPIREYTAAGVNRVFALINDKTLPPEQIPIKVPLQES